MSAVTIGSNILSLNAQRRLAEGESSLSRILERLASGSRINRASDDAAGLSISSSLETDRRVFTQAVRNINDAISAVSIADGAVQQLTDILVRQRELATQAANGTFSLTQRQALHNEAQALVDEYNRIVESTTFNGRYLLSRDERATTVQVGYGTDGTIAFHTGAGLEKALGTGDYTAQGTYSAPDSSSRIAFGDFTGDGILDLVTLGGDGEVRVGNGDGTFQAETNIGAIESQIFAMVDINGDGKDDLVTFSNAVRVRFSNGDGSFSDPVVSSKAYGTTSRFEFADFNSDGFLDILAGSGTNAEVMFGTGSGSFTQGVSFAAAGITSSGDIDGDGNADLISSNATGVYVRYGSGSGSFSSAVTLVSGANFNTVGVGDYNQDGRDDIAVWQGGSVHTYTNEGGSNFSLSQSFAIGVPLGIHIEDANNDGKADLIIDAGNTHIRFGDGEGNFTPTANTVAGGGNGVLADLNNDGVSDIGFASFSDFEVYIYMAETIQVTGLSDLNLNTRAHALASIEIIDKALNRVAAERGNLGSSESRFLAARNTLEAMITNVAAARSRINDIDVAAESAQLVRTQILQQVSSAVLRQANLQPDLVLQLLAP
ncbi:MAG: VCBS repeat-containing protein [Deltaproteobacteria bacterium]|nr:VCBS repeat-containing protein [Deltaproteobacteria bacterium]